jgi:hypothetical protein
MQGVQKGLKAAFTPSAMRQKPSKGRPKHLAGSQNKNLWPHKTTIGRHKLPQWLHDIILWLKKIKTCRHNSVLGLHKIQISHQKMMFWRLKILARMDEQQPNRHKIVVKALTIRSNRLKTGFAPTQGI